jgi:hypothetical protein
VNSLFAPIPELIRVLGEYKKNDIGKIGSKSDWVDLSPQLSNLKQNDILNTESFIERHQVHIQNI